MEAILNAWNWLNGVGLVNLLAAAATIVGIFASIATMTPNESDNKIVDFLLKVINFLGANFGNAKNAKP